MEHAWAVAVRTPCIERKVGQPQIKTPPKKKGHWDWRTYVIPVPHGGGLPSFPAKGVKSDADLPNRAALHVLDAAVSPGPDSSFYCFSKNTSHWNLYRIPVP